MNYYLGADISGCGIPNCTEILHSCGKLLIDICRYTSFQQIVVGSGLIGEILEALDSLKDCEKTSMVGLVYK